MTPMISTHAATNLLRELRAAGVIIEATIDLDGPPDVLTDERIAELRHQKLAILSILIANQLRQLTNQTKSHTVRQHMANMLCQVRHSGQFDLAIAMRDAWNERLAICMMDGRVPENQAERIALDEIETMIQPKERQRYNVTNANHL